MDKLDDILNIPRIRNIYMQAKSCASPQTIDFQVKSTLWDAKGNTCEDAQNNFVITISEQHLNESVVSHELLHIVSKCNNMPTMVMSLGDGMIDFIASELQGYLDHNWILKEQKKIGLEKDEELLFNEILTNPGLEKNSEVNVKKIIILNNMIRTHLDFYILKRDFLIKKIPTTIKYSERIMSHFPSKDILSNREARIAIVRSIREWQNILNSKNIRIDMQRLIAVLPVFSVGQMDRCANATLGFIPNAIFKKDTNKYIHIFYTVSDNQCCWFFSSPEIDKIKHIVENNTLREFLNKMPRLPYLKR